MKIEYDDMMRVNFDNIEIGQCFMYADALYMRIPTKILADHGTVNAVNIETGILAKFEGCEEDDDFGFVTLVDAKLVVSISTVKGEKEHVD